MECRLGSITDEQKVIEAFPDIYAGWDYVPHHFKELADDPKTTMFVGELQGRVVSTLSTLKIIS